VAAEPAVPPPPPRHGDQRVGFAGHHLTRRDRAWWCSCGVELGANRRTARDTMRFHRLDIWVGINSG